MCNSFLGVSPSQIHHHAAPHLNHATNSYAQQSQPLYTSQQSQRQQSSTPHNYQPSHSVLESTAMRAPGDPIVHHRVIVREEIPPPPKGPPIVEIVIFEFNKCLKRFLHNTPTPITI